MIAKSKLMIYTMAVFYISIIPVFATPSKFDQIMSEWNSFVYQPCFQSIMENIGSSETIVDSFTDADALALFLEFEIWIEPSKVISGILQEFGSGIKSVNERLNWYEVAKNSCIDNTWKKIKTGRLKQTAEMLREQLGDPGRSKQLLDSWNLGWMYEPLNGMLETKGTDPISMFFLLSTLGPPENSK